MEKMISNNQLTHDDRFLKLTEAIKFVFASTFFKASKDYFKIPRIVILGRYIYLDFILPIDYFHPKHLIVNDEGSQNIF